MVRHAASIASPPSTATALLYKPWDVFAAPLLLLAKKPAAKFASVICWRGNSPPESRLSPFFALHWIPVAAAAPSVRVMPPRTAFVYETALMKATNLSRRLPRMPALALAAQKKSRLQGLVSKASARSHVAPRVNLSRNLLPKINASTLAALRMSAPKFHAFTTNVRDPAAEQVRMRLAKSPPVTSRPSLAASYQIETF